MDLEKKKRRRQNAQEIERERETAMTVLEHEHQGEMLIYSSPVTERFAVNDKIIARSESETFSPKMYYQK